MPENKDSQGNNLTLRRVELTSSTYKGVELAAVEVSIIDRLKEVDAIVVPSSPELDRQSGAIENLIHDEYGDGPFKALDDKKKKVGFSSNIEMGEAVGVKYKDKGFVFVNIQPEGEGYTQSPEGVRKSTISSLAEASSLGCKSVVMPALGNGMWHVPLIISVSAIAAGIREYVDIMEQQGEKQNLKRVEVALYRISAQERQAIVSPIKSLNP